MNQFKVGFANKKSITIDAESVLSALQSIESSGHNSEDVISVKRLFSRHSVSTNNIANLEDVKRKRENRRARERIMRKAETLDW